MTIRTMYKFVQWLIAVSAVLIWVEFISTGWENMTFQRSFCSATGLLFFFAIQSFLKWKIMREEQEKENVLYQESLIRELDNLKDEMNWNGNARLDVAMQKVFLELKPAQEMEHQ